MKQDAAGVEAGGDGEELRPGGNSCRSQASGWRFLLVACILAVCTGATAQAGSVRGRVLDPRGSAVADAKVKLLNAGGNKIAETTSDSEGNFLLLNVDPG